MEFYVEQDDPQKDLGGLCECFLTKTRGLKTVAEAHIHRHFELLYCLKGGYELMVERQRFILRSGDAALIHPQEPHQTRTIDAEESAYLVLKFTPESLYSANHPQYEMKYIFPYLHFSFRRSDVYTKAQLKESGMESLLLRIFEERQRAEYGYEMAVRADISRALLWFIRAWHKENVGLAIDERTLPRLQKALLFIEDHLDEALNVGMVAEYMGMGESTFSRFFSRAAGSAFPAYVRALRLNRAAARLVESDESITEIAMACGFSSASYLILCFRQQYRMTPAQFRSLYAAGV